MRVRGSAGGTKTVKNAPQNGRGCEIGRRASHGSIAARGDDSAFVASSDDHRCASERGATTNLSSNLSSVKYSVKKRKEQICGGRFFFIWPSRCQVGAIHGLSLRTEAVRNAEPPARKLLSGRINLQRNSSADASFSFAPAAGCDQRRRNCTHLFRLLGICFDFPWPVPCFDDHGKTLLRNTSASARIAIETNDAIDVYQLIYSVLVGRRLRQQSWVLFRFLGTFFSVAGLGEKNCLEDNQRPTQSQQSRVISNLLALFTEENIDNVCFFSSAPVFFSQNLSSDSFFCTKNNQARLCEC